MAVTLNFAHRGANALAPENTMPAFQKALSLGADGLEFDVQMSKDGVVVVIHDEKLDRTTSGTGLVKDYTFSDLQKFDAGAWFAEEYRGLSIPTLDQVLDHFIATDLQFNIELKSGIVLYPGLEKAVLKSINERNLRDRVLISSFNHYSLVACKEIDAFIRTGMLYMAGLYQPWHYARSIGCYSVHPLFYHLQHPELVAGFKEHQLPVYAWTVNEKLYMELLVAGGIEAIITDRPDMLKTVIDAAG